MTKEVLVYICFRKKLLRMVNSAVLNFAYIYLSKGAYVSAVCFVRKATSDVSED